MLAGAALALLLVLGWAWRTSPFPLQHLERGAATPSPLPLETADVGARDRHRPGPALSSYVSARWLQPLIADLTQRSDAGDAEASFALSRVYSECIWFFDPSLVEPTGVPSAQRPALRRSAVWLATRCDGIDGREAALGYARFRRVAADQGSLPAQIEELFNGALTPVDATRVDDQRTLIEAALARSDGEAYLVLSRALGYGAERTNALAPYPTGTPADSGAWMLAACNVGVACGPSSPLLHQLCGTGLLCGADSVQEALAMTLTVEEMVQARERANEVMELSRRIRYGR
ncbi:TPA: hypothetical protein ACXNIY_002628 [Stenotrophomonas maltophilia]